MLAAEFEDVLERLDVEPRRFRVRDGAEASGRGGNGAVDRHKLWMLVVHVDVKPMGAKALGQFVERLREVLVYVVEVGEIRFKTRVDGAVANRVDQVVVVDAWRWGGGVCCGSVVCCLGGLGRAETLGKRVTQVGGGGEEDGVFVGVEQQVASRGGGNAEAPGLDRDGGADAK